MTVSMTDSLLGDAVEVGADLVVLAVGMTPVSEEPILNLQYRVVANCRWANMPSRIPTSLLPL